MLRRKQCQCETLLFLQVIIIHIVNPSAPSGYAQVKLYSYCCMYRAQSQPRRGKSARDLEMEALQDQGHGHSLPDYDFTNYRSNLV